MSEKLSTWDGIKRLWIVIFVLVLLVAFAVIQVIELDSLSLFKTSSTDLSTTIILISLFSLICFLFGFFHAGRQKPFYAKSLWKAGDFVWILVATFSFLILLIDVNEAPMGKTKTISIGSILLTYNPNDLKKDRNWNTNREGYDYGQNSNDGMLVNQPPQTLKGEDKGVETMFAKQYEQLVDTMVKLDKIKPGHQEASEDNKKGKPLTKNDWLKYFFTPLLLSFAIALKLAMTTAEVLNWYPD